MSSAAINFIVGFNDLGSAELWQLANASERGKEYGFEGDNPYIPIQLDFKPGDSFAVAAQTPRNKADFNQRLTNYRNQGFHEKAAAYWAFVDFVEALESEGVLVGGQIFSQALTPPPTIPELSLNELKDKITE